MYQTFAAACIEHHQAPDPRLAVLEGPVFRALVLRPDGTTDLEAFAALWPHMRVMARCTPADKFTLVQVRRNACCPVRKRQTAKVEVWVAIETQHASVGGGV
jgi:hypothetical protein